MAYRVNKNIVEGIMDDLALFGKNHHFRIVYMNDCPYPSMPSFADTTHDIIYLNTNYYDQQELPFVLGHEIGHCLVEEGNSIYGCSIGAKLTAEGKANYMGLYLLFHDFFANYYEGGPVNVADLIDMFDIPSEHLSAAEHIAKACLVHAA